MASSPSVNELVKLLDDPDYGERIGAIFELSELGAAALPAAESVAKRLADPDAIVRFHADALLNELKPEVNWCGWDLDPQLNAQKPHLVVRSLTAADVPRLIRTLRARHSDLRLAAMRALGKLGTEARAAVPAVIGSLRDPHPGVCECATDALAAIGPASDEILSALQSALTQRIIAPRAAQALGRLGPVTLPLLIPLLNEANRELRASAIQAIGEMRAEPETCIPQIAQCLADKQMCSTALEALSHYRQEAGRALPAILDASVICYEPERIAPLFRESIASDDPRLVAALEDSRLKVRIVAADFLSEGPQRERALHVLVQALESPDAGISVNILARVPPPVPQAVPGLIACWGTKRGGTELVAAIKNVTQNGDDPRILNALNAKDALIRLSAAAYLYKAGRYTKHAAQRLLEGLKHKKESIRTSTLQLIKWDMPPSCSEFADCVLDMLLAAEGWEASCAADVLFMMGENARHVAPRLAEHFHDPVRFELVEQALRGIDLDRLRELLHAVRPGDPWQPGPRIVHVGAHDTEEECYERKNPTWEEINLPIQRLDGQRYRHVVLRLNNRDWMRVSSGPGEHYRCAGVFRAGNFYVLLDPDRQVDLGEDDEPELVRIDRTQGLERMPRNRTVTKDLALRAARCWFEHGELDPSLQWSVDPMGILCCQLEEG